MEAHLGDPLAELQQTVKPSQREHFFGDRLSYPSEELSVLSVPSAPHPIQRTPSPEMLYRFSQDELEAYQVPTRMNIIHSCIDNWSSQRADMHLSSEPTESFQNISPANYVPSALGPRWDSLYQAAILILFYGQELLNAYDENERLLSIPFEPTRPITQEELDAHITHRLHLQKIMHRLIISLEVEQLDLAHSIQYYLMRNEDEPKEEQ
jgi:hypothetical protein